MENNTLGKLEDEIFTNLQSKVIDLAKLVLGN